MTQPAIKTRVLTKVRKQFLHKQPSADDDFGDNVSLLPTPDQLNEESCRLLEPSLGLIERKRNIHVGYHFINSYYSIDKVRLVPQFDSNVVTLDLKSNEVDRLPWEYCAKRLQSYGDLELAAWADRLKTYHENYPKKMDKYYESVNSPNPIISAGMAKGREQARLHCQELEKKYIFTKVLLHGNRDSMGPVSLTFHEQMLDIMGHTPETFLQWTKENGIPELFGTDSSLLKAFSRKHLEGQGMKQSIFQEGPEYVVDVQNKENQKKAMKVKVFYVMDPSPEGVFVHIYVVINEPTKEGNNNSPENAKQVKQENISEMDKLAEPMPVDKK